MKSWVLKLSLIAVMITTPFFTNLPMVKAEVTPLSWTSPTTNNLFSVYMLNAGDGWAVGDRAIIHWDGSNWQSVTSPTNAILRSVFMVGASDGWAVGEGGTIIRWDGSIWKNVTSPTADYLNSVSMISAVDGWAVGYMSFIHWGGTSWSNVTVPPSGEWYTSVSMVNSANGWAVGLEAPPTHWNGAGWTLASDLMGALLSIHMSDSSDGWAVGYFGNIIHWNGTSWTAATRPTQNSLNSVFAVSASDAWAVGSTYGLSQGSPSPIIHWNGASWSNASSPTSSPLRSVFMVSSTDGWAVGDNGAIIRFTGTEWVPEFPTALLLPLLFIVTLVVVAVTKNIVKKTPNPILNKGLRNPALAHQRSILHFLTRAKGPFFGMPRKS